MRCYWFSLQKFLQCSEKCDTVHLEVIENKVAPQVGFEPTTLRLTASYALDFSALSASSKSPCINMLQTVCKIHEEDEEVTKRAAKLILL